MQPFVSKPGRERLLVGLFAAVLVPYFVLGLFAQPAADDFVYAMQARDMGLLGALKHHYLHWGGRYFATALQDGFPLACDMLGDYSVLPLVLLPLFILSVGCFLKGLSGAVGGAAGGAISGRHVLAATLAFSAIYLTQMTSVCEGFYWLAGAVTYQLAVVLVLLLAGCALSVRRGASKARIAASAVACGLLAAAVVGSNETLIPVLGLALLAGAVVSFRLRHPSHVVWCIALAVAVAGAVVALTAPGNMVRAGLFSDKPSTAVCLMKGLWATVRHAMKWSVRPVLLGSTLLLVPLIVERLRRTSWAGRIRGWHVATAAGAALGVLLLGFLPAYLSIGLKPPPRALNVLYFVFLAGWFAVLPLAIAWRQNATGRALEISPKLRALGRIALVVGLLGIGGLPRAVYDLACLAPAYRHELQARYARLDEEAGRAAEEAAIEPLQARPKSLHVADVGEDPVMASSFARYFGLNAITTRHGSD